MHCLNKADHSSKYLFILLGCLFRSNWYEHHIHQMYWLTPCVSFFLSALPYLAHTLHITWLCQQSFAQYKEPFGNVTVEQETRELLVNMIDCLVASAWFYTVIIKLFRQI